MEDLKFRVSLLLRCATLFALILSGPRAWADGDHDDDDDDDDGLDDNSGRCNSNLSAFLPRPYSNYSNMICKTVWNTYLLQYSQTKDHVVTIVLSTVYTTGWIGMGFSKDGMMLNSSAMVGWITREGEGRIKQYYLTGFKPSKVIPDKGELPLTKSPPAVVFQGGNIYLAFQLKFRAPLTRQPILLAFGSIYPTRHYELIIHDTRTTITFDFSAGGSESVALDNASNQTKIHGLLGVVGWGVVLPYGAIIARHLKHREPLWYILHIIFQCVGFLMGLGAVISGLQLYGEMKDNFPSHRAIGIVILVLSFLQVFAIILRPNEDSKLRKYWNWYHNWIGRIAIFFGAVNIVLGIHLGGGESLWKLGYGFILASILVTTIVLEALSILSGSQKASLPPAFQKNPL